MGVLSSLTAAGFSYEDYPSTLSYVQDIFKKIYGTDINLSNDTLDGQLCAAFALAIFDTNAQMAMVINSLSPVFAQGAQLSSCVLLNGIARQSATSSTVTLMLTGAAGTIIQSAQAKDSNNIIWNIADGVIGEAGAVDLLATCAITGAIAALENTITIINTSIFGWDSVTNSQPATIGKDAESDASLRLRQKNSTSLPAIAVLSGIKGAIANIDDVVRVEVLENDTNVIDSDGLAPHSIAVIVEGGDDQTIINTIGVRKNIGCATNGDVLGSFIDRYGVSVPVKFYRPTIKNIEVRITLTALSGWTTSIQAQIKNSLINYIGSLKIGEDVLYSRLWTYANLSGSDDSLKYNITSLLICLAGGTPSSADITIAFNEAAKLIDSNTYFIANS